MLPRISLMHFFSWLWKWTLTCGPKVPCRRLLVNTWMYKRGMGTMEYFALVREALRGLNLLHPTEWTQVLGLISVYLDSQSCWVSKIISIHELPFLPKGVQSTWSSGVPINKGLPIHLMNDHKPLRITSPFVWRSPVAPYNQDLFFFFLALEIKQQTHRTLAS